MAAGSLSLRDPRVGRRRGRRLWLAIAIVTATIGAPSAQEALTRDQRIADLTRLASVYAKNYGPYEWKRDVIGFDLYRLTEWLQRVHHADDLDVQEAIVDYVASLNDAHSFVSFPSNFRASLGFTVDIYDGKVLIDSVNRSLLPAAQYPFEVGDELISQDGQTAQSLIESFRKYSIVANQRSTDRFSAELIPLRIQFIMPHAHQIGDTAVAVIRRATSGEVGSHVMPWIKSGFAFESQGPVPSPLRGNGRIVMPPATAASGAAASPGANPALSQAAAFALTDDTLPAYMDPIQPLLHAFVPKANVAVNGLGARSPIYGLPAGFVQRLGTLSSHFFFSGTYVANGVRIGLIRIPTMTPPSVAVALQQLDQEVAFFNANTDVLIVDVMRNTGGLISFSESIAQRLIPTPFRTVGFEVRATASSVVAFQNRLTTALQTGAPPAIVENLRANLLAVLEAYNAERGRSAPISVNVTGSLTLTPAATAYARPLMLLTDEFSASAADMLAAIVQDNHRGPLVGMRTMGAGGTVVGFPCTTYTEASCTMAVSLMNRGTLVTGTEFPPTPYIENVGVRPDIELDYMTRANLVGNGAPFVAAFTQTAVSLAPTPPSP